MKVIVFAKNQKGDFFQIAKSTRSLEKLDASFQ